VDIGLIYIVTGYRGAINIAPLYHRTTHTVSHWLV